MADLPTHESNSSSLSSNVSLLGQLLGKTIQAHLGEEFLSKIETIRGLAKQSRNGDDQARQELLSLLRNLSDDELLPVSRAFSQFLNLANIAEQFHTVSRNCEGDSCSCDPIEALFVRLKEQNLSDDQIKKAIHELSIELVLTAHPTEVTRRTLINKHVAINDCLDWLELDGLPKNERQRLLDRLEQLVNQAWHTDEIRKQRPTPVDEAKWGFAVIENSLWQAVPEFLRQFEKLTLEHFNMRLPLDAAPIIFTSWMGGDRDGNPFVTAKVTEEVLLSSRWVAVDLYLKEISQLVSELSMSDANEQLMQYSNDHDEPYRVILKELRNDLRETHQYLSAVLQGHYTEARDLITSTEQVREPLELCYHSLHDCGMGIIADGSLLDVLRRLACFGINLVRLDIRQDSQRHTDVFSELTRHLGLGDYAHWEERDKQSFLLQELNSKRPLIPRKWEPSEAVQEVLDTCHVVSQQNRDALGIYIISMASHPSDVLAVQLLLSEAGCPFRLPVAPLFETLDDLNNAPATMQNLLGVDWYRGYINGHQHVMIGYSDSAKDAGVLAASWAQYRAQESLVAICANQQIKLTLFHGRGGTIGRGGAPAHAALLSQPPGSLDGGLRVTEQGEMIRFKFGLPKVALASLEIYASAVLEANLKPPMEPLPQWRELMDQMAATSCDAYRKVLWGEEQFVPYFRAATPEGELGKLPLGSRPAKRRLDGGVESLRAIPWIFSWSQNRLLLPAWLGSGEALQEIIDKEQQQTLSDMTQWPFFYNRLEMLEMVFMKADSWLSQIYDDRLVADEQKPLGVSLRENLQQARSNLLSLIKKDELLSHQPWVVESINLRNPYIDPLHVLQVELLNRSRNNSEIHPLVDQALMVSIAGIAAGMRNTG
ncbi:phosphoenolpyruvate carboxylase [Alginatibacterium sediminis]|uniref:Phosphoenolpyruvate carboxylase n=1 Tax=Alginatibacterium sediminis TaxID=2164068 RepID=A0A420EL62_9ALTE|nr:phosphoenolpyruvate carboxylase [Alginatibacterium sediminis]RKF21447.1 phosphoenolpyruvate carboxylase [Alginatibacterium sediminis]